MEDNKSSNIKDRQVPGRSRRKTSGGQLGIGHQEQSVQSMASEKALTETPSAVKIDKTSSVSERSESLFQQLAKSLVFEM